jgi:hypothetical protein
MTSLLHASNLFFIFFYLSQTNWNSLNRRQTSVGLKRNTEAYPNRYETSRTI